MRKNIQFISILFLFLLTNLTCKELKEFQESQPPANYNFVVMTNSQDPLIATMDTEGANIDFYGIRDDCGMPLKINPIVVKNSSDTTIFRFDDSGRPIKISTQNGTQFEFNWISSEKAVLSILTKDGENQIMTEVDFATPYSEFLHFKSGSIRENKPLVLNYTEEENAVNLKSELLSNGNCNVNVLSCNSFTDADVWVNVTDKSGMKKLGTFPAYRIETGKYYTNIPTNLAPTIELNEICNTIVETLKFTCLANKTIPNWPLILCSGISAAVSSGGISALAAPEIFAACLEISVATQLSLNVYCNTVNNSPGPGAPSIAKKICGASFMNRTFPQDVIISAYASALPTNAWSESFVVSGEGPFPPMNIYLSSETAIRNFTLNPASPVEGQDYIATCEIFCLKAGTRVNLSIIGTDGYKDNIEYNVATTQQKGKYSLTVPGADAGVHDVVKLEITLPDGKVILRTASLVFM